MPVVEAQATVAVPMDVAFAVSQTTTPVRYRWDPFIRKQYFTGGATRPGKGVRTFTGEVEFFRAALAAPDESFRVLFVHGPGGFRCLDALGGGGRHGGGGG